MSRRLVWSKFWWEAWETDPALSLCSMAAQGFWMRLLCLCAKADGQVLIGSKRPTPETLARVTRQSVDDVNAWLDELAENGVFSRTRGGVIYSRRMRDDLEKQERSREYGKRGGNPALVSKGKTDKGVNPPVKVEEEEEEEEEPPSPQGGQAGLSLSALVEACWDAANPASRKRSSKADLRRAAEGALKRKHRPERVLAGVVGYFRSDDATRDGGAHAKGVHRIIQNDRWESHLDGGAPTASADDATDDELWATAVRLWREEGFWPESRGPKPGHPGCRVPPHHLIRADAETLINSAGAAA